MNFYATFGFITGLISFGVLIYAGVIQFKEALRPKSWLSRLRWILFYIYAFSVVTAVPGIPYIYLRSIGQEAPALRDFVTITSNLSRLAISFLILLVYTYRRSEDE